MYTTYYYFFIIYMKNNKLRYADKTKVYIRGELIHGNNCYIDVNTICEGKVIIDDDVQIGPNCFLKDVRIGKNTIIKAFSQIINSSLGKSCEIGPFANIRPQNQINDNVIIGNYVELKNSVIGSNSRISHMSFIGDAEIKENVNIGAGTITCNHNRDKHVKTFIDEYAYVGAGCMLIAPIKIGKNVVIGAGSAISQDIDANKIAVSRSKLKIYNLK